MLRIIKLTDDNKNIETMRQQQPDKFVCGKCGCKDIDKLRVFYVDGLINNKQVHYIDGCFCEDCFPFDTLTRFGDTYYLYDECKAKLLFMAKMLQMEGFGHKTIMDILFTPDVDSSMDNSKKDK